MLYFGYEVLINIDGIGGRRHRLDVKIDYRVRDALELEICGEG